MLVSISPSSLMSNGCILGDRGGGIELSDAAFGPDGGAALLQNLDRVFSLLTLAHQVVATAFAAAGLKPLPPRGDLSAFELRYRARAPGS